MRQVDVTENYITGYIQKTYKAHNFNYPNSMYTDLYMNMHGLIGSNKKTRDFSTDIINKKVNLNHILFLRYLKKLEQGIDVSESRRELYRLQKEIAPKENVLHSLRRMIQEWPTLDFNQKRLIFTRLYFWLKNNARLIDIMEPFLIAMQANNMLIPDAKDK